jgi:uncharacterized protein YgiM (DUF1202 family)
MKQNNSRPKSIILTTLLLIGSTFVSTPAFAVNIAEPQENHPSTLKSSLDSQKEFQLAQTQDSCYQIIARSGAYVRREPTVYSEAIGAIAYGRNVEVTGDVISDWVPISAPIPGYVYSDWVAPCNAASPPPSNCRRVVAERGIPVRQDPSRNSEIVGYVSSGRRVILEGQGVNGWVPIGVPLQGYVQSDQLVYCRNYPVAS